MTTFSRKGTSRSKEKPENPRKHFRGFSSFFWTAFSLVFFALNFCPNHLLAEEPAAPAIKVEGSEPAKDGKDGGSDKSEKSDKPEKPIERPTITGWHSWKYNKFSSYDQLRVNIERSWTKKQKVLVSLNGLYYQEDDNKSWMSYVGESYYKFKAGPMDFKLGLLTETLGSGDKISYVDKLNSRRYRNGLANDYNRDKKEVPAVKATYYFNKKYNFDFHYLPIFEPSELPSIYSRWATLFQQVLAFKVLLGAQFQQEPDNRFKEQFHWALNTSFKKYEIRYHYFRFKERLPVVEEVRENAYRLTYPFDETLAMDGNVTLSKDFLIRFEFAYSPNKTFSAFKDKKIGKAFQSDHYGLLLGTDKTFHNHLYSNIQFLVSYIDNMVSPTPVQIKQAEAFLVSQLRQGFKNETLFIEFNSVRNLTTEEYILTPQIILQKGDYLKFIGGIHLNGKSTEGLGPIGQFDQNNTPYFETQVIF